MSEIYFEKLLEDDLPEFRRRLQAAFSVAVIEKYGPIGDDRIPPDEDINSNYRNKGAESFFIIFNGKRVGGVIVTIDSVTNHNHLDFFFIDSEAHSKGLGLAAWKDIEERYPDTEVWETGTPYFEHRNIHFYVNKCGFKITEFYCRQHPDSHEIAYEDGRLPGMEDGFFVFEKIMNPRHTTQQPSCENGKAEAQL